MDLKERRDELRGQIRRVREELDRLIAQLQHLTKARDQKIAEFNVLQARLEEVEFLIRPEEEKGE